MSSTRRSFLGALAVGPALAATANAQSKMEASQEPIKPCVSKDDQGSSPKVVFQINRADDAPAILRFVTNYLKSEPDAEVTVVSYSSGIDFLLKDANDSEGKRYAMQVNRLIDMGVAFKICNNTLKARNVTADVVLANVGVVPSAVTEIIRLQTKEGYSYFRH